jgi:hypothetical protein
MRLILLEWYKISAMSGAKTPSQNYQSGYKLKIKGVRTGLK